jgi:purine-cytosine permease-like protein
MTGAAHAGWRFLYSILAGIFIWFVSLQFNDADAPLWVAGYGIAVLMCLTIAFDVRTTHLYRIALSYCAALMIWIVTLVPNLQGLWWDGEVEREVGGLTLVLLTQLFALPYFRKMSRL